MSLVKKIAPLPATATPHVVALTDRLMETIRQSLVTQDWDGLRPSHFRLLSLVPPEGITITDLAELLPMTKQAAGQFVAHLELTGHLEVRTDQADRRRRLVARTPDGDATVAGVDAHLAAVERELSEKVGPERYRTFLDVLRDLVG